MEKTKLIKDMDVRVIEQIFSRPEAPMQIPEFQRTYAWRGDEINDLVTDLIRLQSLREQENATTHFMGGIVAYEEDQPGSIPKKLHFIVDGQQRLITFQLLFSVIRRHYEKLKETFEKLGYTEYTERASNKISEIDGYFTVEVTDRLGDKHNVNTLKPSPMDSEGGVYQKIIDHSEDATDLSSESHRKLRSARNKLDKDLVRKCKPKSGDNVEYFTNLGILLETVKQDCQVIYIVCPKLSDAYELFQVLNDRGKSLTDGDLLRAYTFKLLDGASGSKDDKSEISQYWDEILSDPDSRVKQFLEQYYRTIKDDDPQKRQLYRQFQDDVFEKLVKDKSQAESVTLVKSQVKEMRSWYKSFAQVVDGEWPYQVQDNNIHDYDKYRLELLIKVLSLKNVSILVAASQKLPQSEFREIVFLIERFFFRYKTICDGSADKIGATFGKHAHRITNGNFNLQDLKDNLNELIAEGANDDLFKTQLRLNLVYKEGKTKQIIRFFLTYLEHHRKLVQPGLPRREQKVEKTPIHVVERSSSVEHIYPQNPESKDVDSDIEDYESRGDLTDCVGNLTFLSVDDNTNLDNQPYKQKHQFFEQSNIWLNQKLATDYDENSWTAEAIIERENWLLDIAVSLFVI